MIRRSALLAVLLLLAVSLTAGAAVIDEIARDFQPLSGYVVMPVEDEFLIDRDAGHGVAAGDLFAVVRPGEKIVHPLTGEVLGTLDAAKGLLQVTRLKSGYAFARPVGETKGIAAGDPVHRFANIPAAFWDFQGTGEGLYERLQAALPRLEWQGYVRVAGEQPSADVPPLVFALRAGTLEVLGPEGVTLRSYRLETAKATPAGDPAPAISQRQPSAAEAVWTSPALPGEAAGVAVADLDGDGRLEIAVAFPYRLEIGRVVDGRYEQVANLDLGLGQKVVSLDSADLDGDGAAELYLTAAERGGLQSLAVARRGEGFTVTHRNLPWYFRTVGLPGGGEALLAQGMGGLESDFAGPIFRVALESGKLVAGEEVAVPRGVELYGFSPFKGPAGENLFAQLNFLDHLKVMQPAGEVLWEGQERFGGSEAFVERTDPAMNPAAGPDTRHAFMQQRLEIGPGGELLVPVNEGSRLLKRGRSFDRSHVKAMAWNGFALHEVWRTGAQEAYLADFRLADGDNDGKKELVQVLVVTREGILRKPRSVVAVYELP